MTGIFLQHRRVKQMIFNLQLLSSGILIVCHVLRWR